MSHSNKVIPFPNGNKPKSPARGKRFSKQEKQAATEAILRAYRPAGSVRIA